MPGRGVIIVSGGMDSVTLAYAFKRDDLHLLSFNYGQRHSKELVFARQCAEDIDAQWDFVDLQTVGSLLKGSALTDDISVPDGHYAEDTMKMTVVPNRNAIMLSIATGVAVAEHADYVATAVHAGDHFIYPDCRMDFISKFNAAMISANDGFAEETFRVIAPFGGMKKSEICKLGADVGVDFEKTWSCYKGGEIHCGVCGTCTERREAFIHANVEDPTAYENLTTEHLEKSDGHS